MAIFAPEPRTGVRAAATAAVAAVVVLAAAGCNGTEAPAPQEPLPASSGTGPQVIASGLDVPWAIAFHEDVPLVSERDSGRILELGEGGSSRVAGTVDDAAGRGEGGLLGIAVQDGYLYTYFTAGSENRIERRPLTGEPGALALGSAQTLLDGIPAGPVHNGGRLAFGPDGMLYATTGDAGNRDSAQDLGALAGKILRMNPDGSPLADNPFPGSLVYSYGHRNPQGIAWDADGNLYASEFGQDTWDELNIIRPGGNYGWPTVEGIARENGFTDPVQQWHPDEASPSGIAVAGNSVYIANLRGERLRVVPLRNPGSSEELLAGEYGRLRDAVQAPDGSVWILTNNTDGRGQARSGDDHVLRITADQPAPE